MVSINKNTTTNCPTTSPTVTTTCQVATTSVAKTCNAINTPTSTNNNVKIYTASAPKTNTASNTPTPIPTPTAVNNFVPTPTTMSNSTPTSTINVSERISYTTNVTGKVTGRRNPSVSSTPEVTATPDYGAILKGVESAFWQTPIGIRAEAFIEGLEEKGQNFLDYNIDAILNYFKNPSSPMPTPNPSTIRPEEDSSSSRWTDNFSGEITNGGYKNLGVKGGYYSGNYYVEAKYQVKGFEVSAGTTFHNGGAKISTSDFKDYLFYLWFYDACGGKLSAAARYCTENGAASLDVEWFNENISIGATAGDDYYGISASFNF